MTLFGKMWHIKYFNSKGLKKDQQKLRKNKSMAQKIKKYLEKISLNPLSEQINIRKIKPKSSQRYRLKIDDWQIIFSLDFGNHIILIYRIAPRGDVYEKL